MTPEIVYTPESAMAIFAHPDDIEFTCAGTLAIWARRGARISYVLCTSGDVGLNTPGMTKEKAAAIRETEQRKAAEITGAKEAIFLKEPDGMLQSSLALRKKIVREIRRFRPEVIITGDPTVFFPKGSRINHPDHRAAATAALDAAFPAAGQPNLFEELEQEGVTAFKPRKVFVVNPQTADTFIDISETIDVKIQALRAHSSQFENWDPAERIRQRAAAIGEKAGMKFAEAFRVITLESDDNWHKLNRFLASRQTQR